MIPIGEERTALAITAGVDHSTEDTADEKEVRTCLFAVCTASIYGGVDHSTKDTADEKGVRTCLFAVCTASIYGGVDHSTEDTADQKGVRTCFFAVCTASIYGGGDHSTEDTADEEDLGHACWQFARLASMTTLQGVNYWLEDRAVEVRLGMRDFEAHVRSSDRTGKEDTVGKTTA